MADVDPKYSELSLSINALTQSEREALARRVPMQEIKDIFENIKSAIAQEAKNRVQSKIALNFNHGYGTGALFNSIYYKIEGDNITVSSTKNYFAILNYGIKPFDMKQGKLGNPVKMRLPGGAVIYRRPPSKENNNPRKRKTPLAQASWWYPGFSGAHVYEIVTEEMKVWMNAYVNTEVRKLLERAKGNDEDYFGISQRTGRRYYKNRDERGNFAGRFSNDKEINKRFSGLLKEDQLKFQYTHIGNNFTAPLLSRTGKYLITGDKGYIPGESILRMHNRNLGRKGN